MKKLMLISLTLTSALCGMELEQTADASVGGSVACTTGVCAGTRDGESLLPIQTQIQHCFAPLQRLVTASYISRDSVEKAFSDTVTSLCILISTTTNLPELRKHLASVDTRRMIDETVAPIALLVSIQEAEFISTLEAVQEPGVQQSFDGCFELSRGLEHQKQLLHQTISILVSFSDQDLEGSHRSCLKNARLLQQRVAGQIFSEDSKKAAVAAMLTGGAIMLLANRG